ncbi:AAA family ATPase [Paenibacillus sp. FSL P4-0338]|uniref:AAA family ATPase n=1 Tax=Paenibacillus sp. FSL P4-0338 TaxID=2921635 RepID=UPI0030F56836
MKIRSITIKNLRLFEDETFNFNPHINVFIGENGSGKSTILRSFVHLLNSLYPKYNGELLNSSDILQGKENFSISADFQASNNEIEQANLSNSEIQFLNVLERTDNKNSLMIYNKTRACLKTNHIEATSTESSRKRERQSLKSFEKACHSVLRFRGIV